MPLPHGIRGLYFIADSARCGARGVAPVAASAIRGGAVMIQYRDKSGDADRRRREAEALNAICAAGGIPLIVNDDIELARTTGAAGVHLGGRDPDLSDARRRLGSAAILGSSCYSSLERARRAVQDGVDYVSFGAFHRSTTKPSAPLAPLSLLHDARQAIPLPVVAIGGIDAHNARPLIEAGADLLAVIGGVCAADDPEAAARSISRLFA
jgi:thiamine-phosphate pyrophosphorylase